MIPECIRLLLLLAVNGCYFLLTFSRSGAARVRKAPAPDRPDALTLPTSDARKSRTAQRNKTMKCHTCRPEGAPSFLCAFRNGKPLPRSHEVSNVVQNETRQRLKGPTLCKRSTVEMFSRKCVSPASQRILRTREIEPVLLSRR